ncbi:MAG: hypothetical protein CL916_12715 [Deltaproteobacteria bacterium]|nr:hypothetical protein [Deltaproteobacteria bacterium]
MSKWLKTLEKMGLVQLEEGDAPAAQTSPDTKEDLDSLTIDIDRMTRELEGFSAEEEEEIKITVKEPSVAPPQSPAGTRLDSETIDSTFRVRDLSKIYEEAAIEPSPYPIERMVRLLDGLKAMPENMRLQAVKAMDLADDTWTIEDSILDGQRKAQAVSNERTRILKQLQSRTQHIEEEKQKQSEYLSQMTAEIQLQIAELERILEEETKLVATQKAELDAELSATQHAYEETDFALKNRLESIKKVITSIQK